MKKKTLFAMIGSILNCISFFVDSMRSGLDSADFKRFQISTFILLLF